MKTPLSHMLLSCLLDVSEKFKMNTGLSLFFQQCVS